jgi:hypothetical protein
VQLAIGHDTAPDRSNYTLKLCFAPKGKPVGTLRLYMRKRWLGLDAVKLIDGQTIAARAYGQVTLDLRALPRGATICAMRHDAPPDDPQIIAFTIIPA